MTTNSVKRRSRGWNLVFAAAVLVGLGLALIVLAGSLGAPSVPGFQKEAAAAMPVVGLVLTSIGILFAGLGTAGLVVLLSSQQRREYLGLREWLDGTAPGWAGWLDLHGKDGRMSLRAIRKQAVRLRPSLGRRAMSAPAEEVGNEVGPTTVGPLIPVKLYSSFEEVVYHEGPTRSGKSGKLAKTIACAPGAVVAATTRGDLYKNTALIRGRDERPIWVLNPAGVGGIPNSLRWNPVEGCQFPEVARRRAAYLVTGTKEAGGTEGVKDGDFWSNNSATILRVMLMAAAFMGRDMGQVQAWITHTDLESPARVLENNPNTPAGVETWIHDMRQWSNTAADRARASVLLTLRQTVDWMSDQRVVEVVRPDASTPGFDVVDLLERRGTLYLIAESKPYGSVAPLFTALVGEIHELSKLMGSQQENERLDPPLTEVLDEAYLIVPVPLPQYTSDAGGSGICIHIGVQDYAQMVQRWGKEGARIIFNNATVKLMYPGSTDEDQLERISKLCGPRDVKTRSKTKNAKGETSMTEGVQEARLLRIDQLRKLPDWTAVVLHRQLTTVVRITPIWKDRTCKRLARKARKQPLAPAPPLPAPMVEGSRSDVDTDARTNR